MCIFCLIMSVTLESLEVLLDKKFSEFEASVLKPIMVSIEEIKASINFLSVKYDDLDKAVKDLEKQNKILQLENSSLKVQLLAQAKEINQHHDLLNEYEQYSRRECLEISGIPQRPRENTNQIVIDIGEAIGVDITEEDISVSHRLAPNKRYPSRPPNIIAKFVRRDMKEQLYRARNQLRNKTSHDIGFSVENRIFIS